jgi:hypothetical protein
LIIYPMESRCTSSAIVIFTISSFCTWTTSFITFFDGIISFI